MTELDKALEIFQQDMTNPMNQSHYYDLFLNSTFYVPTNDEQTDAADGDNAVPLIISAEGNDYLMLFDTEERLRSWAQAEVSFVEVPGHIIAAMSVAPLHWALNVGTDNPKEFVPDEIAWLKDSVERCTAEAAQEKE